MEGNGVEGNAGVYARVQKLKKQLKKEMNDESTKQELAISSRHKILVVTHSRVL